MGENILRLPLVYVIRHYDGESLTSTRIHHITSEALHDSFKAYVEYVKNNLEGYDENKRVSIETYILRESRSHHGLRIIDTRRHEDEPTV